MNEYPKMLYRASVPFKTPEEVAVGIARKDIQTMIVKDSDEEAAFVAEGFGPLDSLGTKRRARKVAPEVQDAQEV